MEMGTTTTSSSAVVHSSNSNVGETSKRVPKIVAVTRSLVIGAFFVLLVLASLAFIFFEGNASGFLQLTSKETHYGSGKQYAGKPQVTTFFEESDSVGVHADVDVDYVDIVDSSCDLSNVVVAIKSGASGNEYQQRRQFWRNSNCANLYQSNGINYNFILGLPEDPQELFPLREERDEFEDMVILPIEDDANHKNNVLKTFHTFQWAVTTAPFMDNKNKRYQNVAEMIVLHDDKYCVNLLELQEMCRASKEGNVDLYGGYHFLMDSEKFGQSPYFAKDAYVLSRSLVEHLVQRNDLLDGSYLVDSEALRVGTWVDHYVQGTGIAKNLASPSSTISTGPVLYAEHPNFIIEAIHSKPRTSEYQLSSQQDYRRRAGGIRLGESRRGYRKLQDPTTTGFVLPTTTGFTIGSTTVAPTTTGFTISSTTVAPTTTGFTISSTTVAPTTTGFTISSTTVAPTTTGFTISSTTVAPTTTGFTLSSTTVAPTTTGFTLSTAAPTTTTTTTTTTAIPSKSSKSSKDGFTDSTSMSSKSSKSSKEGDLIIRRRHLIRTKLLLSEATGGEESHQEALLSPTIIKTHGRIRVPNDSPVSSASSSSSLERENSGGVLTSGVFCGENRIASGCSECFQHQPQKEEQEMNKNDVFSWCGGDCKWDYILGACQHKRPTVNCGRHMAESCEMCPDGNGESWCNGDCAWNKMSHSCEEKSNGAYIHPAYKHLAALPPFQPVTDENGQFVNILLVRHMFVDEEHEALFHKFKNEILFLGIMSYESFPFPSPNPRSIQFPKDKYLDMFPGWLNMYHDSTFFPADVKVVDLSQSDFEDHKIDYEEEVAQGEHIKRFDFGYAMSDLNITEDGKCDSWGAFAKNWSFVRDDALDILCGDLGMTGILAVTKEAASGKSCRIPSSCKGKIVQTPFISQEELFDYMRQSRFWFLPQIYDASPRVATQAMTMNLPLLMNRNIVGGWKYVQEGTTGEFFHDKSDFRESVERIMTNLNSYTPREHFLKNYGIEIAGAKFQKFVQDNFSDRVMLPDGNKYLVPIFN